MRLLRNFLALLLFLLLVLLLFIPVVVIAGVCRRQAFIFFSARLVIRCVLAALGVHVRVRGLDAVDLTLPPVIVSNHLSNLDGPLLISILPLNPRVLIKAEARRIPLIGWIMDLAGFVFVDRASAARRQEALAAAVAKIRRERCPFLVFPEGTRSRDGVMKEFKKGSFIIAQRSGAPLLPVRIDGTDRLLPPGRRTCGAGAVTIEFFPLVDMSGVTESGMAGFVRDLQRQLYGDASHEYH